MPGTKVSEVQRRVWNALRRDPRPGVVAGMVVAVVLAGLGGFVSLRGPTTYHSTAVMIIDDPAALATAGDDGQLLKLDVLRVKYSALVGTQAIAGPVAAEFHLPVGAVLGAVSTQVPYESLLMDVSATWSSAEGAQQLAQATADEVTAYVVNEAITYNIPPADRYTFTVIDPATAAAEYRPSRIHAVTLAVGLAVLGFLLAFASTQLWRHRAGLR